MKSYPNIKQCKMLSKILPIESADMYYVLIDTDKNKYSAGLGKYIGILPHYPCWSLAALLEIIANAAAHIDEDGYLDATVCKDVHCVSLINCNGELYKADNLVDACYEMILKLHELNLL